MDMESSLSKEEIEMYRRWYAESEPYTEKEIDAIPFDGDLDYMKLKAWRAKTLLEWNGIPLVADDD